MEKGGESEVERKGRGLKESERAREEKQNDFVSPFFFPIYTPIKQ